MPWICEAELGSIGLSVQDQASLRRCDNIGLVYVRRRTSPFFHPPAEPLDKDKSHGVTFSMYQIYFLPSRLPHASGGLRSCQYSDFSPLFPLLPLLYPFLSTSLGAL